MDAGVDRVIHTEQDHPSFAFSQRMYRCQWFVERLFLQLLAGVDPTEGEDGMHRSLRFWVEAQRLRNGSHQGINGHTGGKEFRHAVEIFPAAIPYCIAL